MTIFIVSHNLQINSEMVPILTAEDLADGLLTASEIFKSASALNHPHWLIRLEADITPEKMALHLISAWRELRLNKGHLSNHCFLALGGRKDTQAGQGSPLVSGSWGVDFVECKDPDIFLRDINWDALKSGRPLDAVFEVRG